MSLRPVPFLLLLTACSSAPSPSREEPASAPPSSNVVTASTQSAPPKDTMILETKLAVCEKFVHEVGEHHALELLGFRSLLPERHAPVPLKSEEFVGVWRSGINPVVHEGGKEPIPIYEERIHYLADGRVCGVQQSFDLELASADKKQTFISLPFSGTWKLTGSTLIEDYSKGTPPQDVLRNKQTRRSRKVVSLFPRGKTDHGLRFNSSWPNYFETVVRAKVAGLRRVDDDLETMKGELPSWCFESELKERAEK